MRRDLGLTLILGCILILLLEAPAALSSVGRDIQQPYPLRAKAEPREAPAPLEVQAASVPAKVPGNGPGNTKRPEALRLSALEAGG